VIVQRQPDLFKVVLTLQPVRRLTDFLDGGQEQADQNGDDGNDDEQLDERKGGAADLSHVLAPGAMTP
jgi:hypothetical protein